MTNRAFTPWVEPIAAQIAAAREEFVAVARSVPAEAWGQASPAEGWTYKDVLAHLAGDTDKQLLSILRAVVSRQPINASLLGSSPDERNTHDIVERRERQIDTLIAEVEADTEEHLDLLSRLTEDDQALRQDDIPMSLGEGLSNDPGGHARGHIAQLRTALES
jgi:uncharacterized protein (TIGR03083 family)